MPGFDDDEVMAAVSEVAKDPAAFKKYANNPKVSCTFAASGSGIQVCSQIGSLDIT